ncbi:MAG: beta strand repeat-containing protein, partial [Cyclobacteriaceae bacterium]
MDCRVTPYRFFLFFGLFGSFSVIYGQEVNLSVSTNSASESAQTIITLTVTASSPVSGKKSVDVNVAGLGITAEDYALSNTVIAISNGQTVGVETFTVQDDAVFESDEIASISISSPSSGITLGATTQEDVTITDNEVVSADLSVTQQGLEAGSQDIVYILTLSNTNNTGSTISFDVVDLGTGTATSGSDYTGVGSTISVTDGSDTGTLTLLVIDDADFESDTEDVDIQISNPSNGDVTITTATAESTITDNEVVSADLSVTQQGLEAGSQGIVYTLTLSNTNNTGSTITFDVVDLGTGTATSGIDYIGVGSTISVVNGASTGTYLITVSDDAIVEPSQENLNFQISSPSNLDVTITTAIATASIADDDASVLSITGFTVSEDGVSADFTVSADAGIQDVVTVAFATSDVSAVAGSDYTSTSTTLSFGGVNALSQTVTIPILTGVVAEATETLVGTLSSLSANSQAVTLTGGGVTTSATGTITDDDAYSLSIGDALGITEGDENFTQNFTVTMTGPAASDVVITYSTATGTAGVGDFTGQTTETYTIPAGETTALIPVEIIGDDIVERDESFTGTISLSNVNGQQITLLDNEATGTIADDDASVLSITGFTVSE